MSVVSSLSTHVGLPNITEHFQDLQIIQLYKITEILLLSSDSVILNYFAFV